MDKASTFNYCNDVSFWLHLLSCFFNTTKLSPFSTTPAVTSETTRHQVTCVFVDIAPLCWFEETCRSLLILVIIITSISARVVPIFNLVETRCHIAIKVVVIPYSNDNPTHALQEPLNATNVWKHVQNSVAVASDLNFVQVHFDLQIHHHIETFFVGTHSSLVYFEDRFVFELSKIIQVQIFVLEEKMSCWYLILNGLLELSVYG